jgi:hypothetical protein
VNLIFVVSEDLAFNAPGDIDPGTSNFTARGLQRSLQLATFLRRQVLGESDASGVFALAPMTHLQTAQRYPDMVPLETIQQFAVLNRVTLSSDLHGGTPYSGQNVPVNASYAPGSVPAECSPPRSTAPPVEGWTSPTREATTNRSSWAS